MLPKLDPGHSSLTGSLSLSGAAAGYVTSTGALGFGALFYHALAVLHAPAYRTENAGALRQDWPRVPLPATAPVLLASSELGQCIALLLDSETPAKGVTTGQLRSELRPIAVPTPTAGRALSEEDLALTAGWGHAGKGGVTMPAKGKWIERDYTPDERLAITEAAADLGMSPEQAVAQLGDLTCDVYLNDAAYWRNVPIRVWEYTIGGYQVIKKWLSYRECKLLGRALTKDEVREVQNIARRIAAILLLQPALDANYSRIRNHTYPWQKPGGPCL